ncbi:MAG: hypothetical protein ACOCWO_02535, partial [Candidatus Muiribacteriaceae bacterium]
MRRPVFFLYIYIFTLFVYSTAPISRIVFEREYIRNHSFEATAQYDPAGIGDEEFFHVLTPANSYQKIKARCRKVGTYSYVFVQDGYTVEDRILDEFVRRFEDQEGIRDRLRRNFGEEWDPGIDVDSRIYILITDMGDISQVDPEDNFYPIDGYYSYLDEVPTSVFEKSNEKELIYLNIELFDYWDSKPDGINPALSVLSREYFRMIHFYQEFIQHNLGGVISGDLDAEGIEDIWVDYGLAVYAEKEATGKFDPKYINALGRETCNSLVMFEKSLANISLSEADMGLSSMFFEYIDQRYGEQAVYDIAKQEKDGIEGVETALATHTTDDILDIVHNFMLTLYLDSPNVPEKYRLYDIDIPLVWKGMTPVEEEYNAYKEDIRISPSVKILDVPLLRMGASLAIRVDKRFFPEKYVHILFKELEEADSIRADIFLFKGDEFIDEYKNVIDQSDPSVSWNEIMKSGDNIRIILSDMTNDLKTEGDYKFPIYTELSSDNVSDEYKSTLTDYFNRIGKDYTVKFIEPDMAFTIYPTPLVPDHLHVNIHADGETSALLSRPDGSTEDIGLSKIRNVEKRFAGTIKAADPGEYTVEVSIQYNDGNVQKKEYTFLMIAMGHTSDVIIDDITIENRAAPANIVVRKEDEKTWQIESMAGEEMELTLRTADENCLGIYRKTSDGLHYIDS